MPWFESWVNTTNDETTCRSIQQRFNEEAERGSRTAAAGGGGCLLALAMLPLTVVLAALGIRRPGQVRAHWTCGKCGRNNPDKQLYCRWCGGPGWWA